MIPSFSAVDFVSFYVEIPVMLVMFVGWMVVRRPVREQYDHEPETIGSPLTATTPLLSQARKEGRPRWHDIVDTTTVDLTRDEYEEDATDKADDELRAERLKGQVGLLWRLYYWVI